MHADCRDDPRGREAPTQNPKVHAVAPFSAVPPHQRGALWKRCHH